MKRRKWDAATKAQVVIEGLKGRPVAEICTAYQIGQNQYYKWRDQFLASAPRVFEAQGDSAREQRLIEENRRLKGAIGDLTLELKKTTGEGAARALGAAA
jgi:transposase-like protein